MNRKQLLGIVSIGIFSLGFTSIADAELFGRLPATPGGTDYQAYYDDQLDITWAANSNINGLDTWFSQMDWVAGLEIDDVGGWRLPNMDRNGDGIVNSCNTPGQQESCKDNEYGHLHSYGAGTLLSGPDSITSSDPGPFSNIQTDWYWSGTTRVSIPTQAWVTKFSALVNDSFPKDSESKLAAWAVHDGDARSNKVFMDSFEGD